MTVHENEELQKYEKKSTVADNIGANSFLKETGIDIWASFMLHPDWNKQDFKSFRKYLKILNPEISTFAPLTPFPNLPLYNEYHHRLIASETDYEKWSFGQVTIQPSQMSLRNYYLEILKTNLYVNLIRNSIKYITKKFGFFTVFRLLKGSIGLLIKHIQLMK